MPGRVIETRRATALRTITLLGVAFVHEPLGDVTHFDVAVGRGANEEGESAVIVHLVSLHEDADRLPDDLASANRFALIHRVESMKRAESRARKITEMVAMLAHGETLHPQKAGHPERAGRDADARFEENAEPLIG